MQISLTVLELYELKVFNFTQDVKFDLKGEKSFVNEVAHLVIKLQTRKLMQISMYNSRRVIRAKVFNLTSEVNGQFLLS